MEMFRAKYKITLTHKKTKAETHHYFEELRFKDVLDFIAVHNESNEFEVNIEIIDKAVAFFD